MQSSGSSRPQQREFRLPRRFAQCLLPAESRSRTDLGTRRLSATRKKRKPSPDAASVDEIKAFAQGATVPSVHTTKPPGVSALTLAKNGELFVSGG